MVKSHFQVRYLRCVTTAGSRHIILPFNHLQKPFPALFAPMPAMLSLNDLHTADTLKGTTGASPVLGYSAISIGCREERTTAPSHGLEGTGLTLLPCSTKSQSSGSFLEGQERPPEQADPTACKGMERAGSRDDC